MKKWIKRGMVVVATVLAVSIFGVGVNAVEAEDSAEVTPSGRVSIAEEDYQVGKIYVTDMLICTDGSGDVAKIFNTDHGLETRYILKGTSYTITDDDAYVGCAAKTPVVTGVYNGAGDLNIVFEYEVDRETYTEVLKKDRFYNGTGGDPLFDPPCGNWKVSFDKSIAENASISYTYHPYITDDWSYVCTETIDTANDGDYFTIEAYAPIWPIDYGLAYVPTSSVKDVNGNNYGYIVETLDTPNDFPLMIYVGDVLVATVQVDRSSMGMYYVSDKSEMGITDTDDYIIDYKVDNCNISISSNYNLDEDGIDIYVDVQLKEGWMTNEDGSKSYFQGTDKLKSQWLLDAGDWYYLKEDGNAATGWISLNDIWYYLNDEGIMQTGWQEINGKWYYFYENGGMATTTWIGDYYVDETGVWTQAQSALIGTWISDVNGWWYQNKDGSYPTDVWKLIDGEWYYFDSEGWMQTGWIKDGGTWYYLNGSGAMVTGWIKDGGAWYYLNDSGAMATGWINNDGTWYYLNSSGVMQIGWIKDGGTWYYLKDSGAMATGWIKDGSTWYYLYSSGAMAYSTVIEGYYLDDSGAWK